MPTKDTMYRQHITKTPITQVLKSFNWSQHIHNKLYLLSTMSFKPLNRLYLLAVNTNPTCSSSCHSISRPAVFSSLKICTTTAP